MRIEVKCAECGGNNFKLGDEFEADSRVTCEDCGHVMGSMTELQEKVAQKVMELARSRPSGR